MKPIFFAFLMLLSFFAQTGQAAEPKLTSSVVRAFEGSFSEAENAQWSPVGDLLKVTFTLHDHSMFAFYNTGGELVVNGKYLTVKQLPKDARKKLAEEAKGYKITEVFEISDGLDSKYYATLVNATEEKVMVSMGGKWSTFKTTSK